jgi:hypothetical protein
MNDAVAVCTTVRESEESEIDSILANFVGCVYPSPVDSCACIKSTNSE